MENISEWLIMFIAGQDPFHYYLHIILHSVPFYKCSPCLVSLLIYIFLHTVKLITLESPLPQYSHYVAHKNDSLSFEKQGFEGNVTCLCPWLCLLNTHLSSFLFSFLFCPLAISNCINKVAIGKEHLASWKL